MVKHRQFRRSWFFFYIYSPQRWYYWYYIISSLIGDATGTITVNGGNQSYLKIRDASGGAGVEVGDVTMTTDESLTLYAAVYDADNNYLQDVSADWTNSGSLNEVNTNNSVFVFSPVSSGTVGTIIISSGSLIGDATGTITVINPPLIRYNSGFY